MLRLCTAPASSLGTLALLLSGCPQLAQDEFFRANPDGATTISTGTGLGGTGVATGGNATTTTGTIGSQGGASTASTPTDSSAGGSGSAGGSAATGGSGGAGGISSTSSTSTTSSQGGSSAVGGSGGAPPEILDCSDRRVLSDPAITDFDDYDGDTDPLAWLFPIGVSQGSAWGDVQQYTDGSGAYVLQFVSGVSGTGYALSAKNAEASAWGGGILLRTHCVDASAYTGLEFMLRGVTPARSLEVALLLNDNISYATELEVPRTWTRIAVDFADLRRASNQTMTADGNGVVGIRFSSQLVYVQTGVNRWEPEPGAYNMEIDSVSFY